MVGDGVQGVTTGVHCDLVNGDIYHVLKIVLGERLIEIWIALEESLQFYFVIVLHINFLPALLTENAQRHLFL